MVLQEFLLEVQLFANRSEDDLLRVSKRGASQLAINGALLSFFLYQFFNNNDITFFIFIASPLIISSIYCIRILLPYPAIRIFEIEITGDLNTLNLDQYYKDEVIPYYTSMHSENVKINRKLVAFIPKMYYWFFATIVMIFYMIILSFIV